jgi:hypothetical protein
MGMPHASAFKMDAELVSAALKILERATATCSENDLRALRAAGTLPTGIADYLIACRVGIGE